MEEVMRVHELIEMLEELNPDAEVRMAWQPHYPLQAMLGSVVPAQSGDPRDENECSECHGAIDLQAAIDEGYPDADPCSCGPRDADAPIVYLLEGESTENPYASGSLWDAR